MMSLGTAKKNDGRSHFVDTLLEDEHGDGKIGTMNGEVVPTLQLLY